MIEFFLFAVLLSKFESRKYPSALQVSVKNVLGFVISNLSRCNRLKAIATIVKYRSKRKQSIENAMSVLRHETEDSIIDSLRAWRFNPRRRNYILRRIQALRRLYFTLHSHSHDDNLNHLEKLISDVSNVWMHDTSASSS